MIQLSDMRRLGPGRHRTIPVTFLLTILLAACQGGGSGPASPSARQSAPPKHKAGPNVLGPAATSCSASVPCPMTAGAYRLGQGTVLPGLELTLPAGWSSTENTQGVFNLRHRGLMKDTLSFWLDMLPVKSTGLGHGTTVLKNVGTTARALTAWLTHDPDFLIVSGPAQASVGRRITMTSLVVGVSKSANYGDPGCPANPRCADLFTNPYWGGDWYGIGGNAQVRLYLGTIKIGGTRHTFIIALDALNHAHLLRLEKVAKPVMASVGLPAGATGS